MKRFFLLLFLLQFQAFAVFAIKDVRVEPAFAKPGEEMTIYFTMVHDYNKFISIGGMLSEDNIWEMTDRLFLFNGNEGKLPKENPTDWDLSNLYRNPNQEYIGWYEYSWRFIVPADLSEGDIFYLILRPDQANQPNIKALSSSLETSIKVEVSENKAVIYNTATMGEKKATGSYIITQGLPKADLKATPSAGVGGIYTFNSATLDVDLETNNVNGAQIFYTVGNKSVDITDNSQLYDPAVKVTLSGDDTINAVAVVPGYSNQKGSWYYRQLLPEATLFATPSQSIPDEYIFSTVDLSVELGLISEGDTVAEVSSYEIYYTLKHKKPVPGNSDTHKYTGAITLTGSDTIRAVVVSENFTTVPEGMWYYKQDLPDAYIFANPSATAPVTYDFTTTALVVDLGVIGGGDSLEIGSEVEIYYTHNNRNPVIGDSQTKQYTKSNPVNVTGDDTIRAIAVAEGYDDISEGVWYYNQTLPKAKLEANPGSDDVYVYQGAQLPVRLSTDKGNTIYYTQNGSEPDKNSPSIFESGEITVYGDQTIKAIALGEGYRQSDTVWEYESHLPAMYLKADAGLNSPQDTLGFFFDTTVTLTVVDESGESVADAEIFYLIDTVGDKGGATDADLLYSGIITVDTTVTIRALALHKDYKSASYEWCYSLQQEENWIKAFTSDTSHWGESIIQGDSIISSSDTAHFGYDLDIVLATKADSLFYIKDGQKSFYMLDDTIHLDGGDPDTVRIEVASFGHGYEKVQQELVFVRDTVAVLSVDPVGHTFSESVKLILSLTKSWRNGTIYYDLGDGMKEYSKPVKLEKSCLLKAIAKADFAVDSRVINENYTKAATVQKSWYFDQSGDGAIDQLYIEFTDSLVDLPDSVQAFSPLNKSESRIIAGDQLSRMGDKGIVVSFNTPFTFSGSTFFDAAPLAIPYGKGFLEEPFMVDDSVAPVIVEATYAPGEIVSIDPVSRKKDRLHVRFSEVVTIQDKGKPFFLKQGDGEYYLRLDNASESKEEWYFDVKSIHGVDYPSEWDSIHIDMDAGVNGNGGEQLVWENRYVPLRVLDIPYRLIVQALTPADPTEFKIPDELISEHYPSENGILIVADFLMKMENDNQDGRIAILDKVGNVIIENSGRYHSGEHLLCDVLQGSQTRVVFYWDGKNSLGRDVGRGDYVAGISIYDGREHWIDRTVHLGIIREK